MFSYIYVYNTNVKSAHLLRYLIPQTFWINKSLHFAHYMSSIDSIDSKLWNFPSNRTTSLSTLSIPSLRTNLKFVPLVRSKPWTVLPLLVQSHWSDLIFLLILLSGHLINTRTYLACLTIALCIPINPSPSSPFSPFSWVLGYLALLEKVGKWC